ncbi:MAG TPA: DUF6265 family protein [Thermoanaerobaculia bacterium]|nr:DUF6265 family protein [Thermoanaerobaculia bacterium]
MKTLLLLLALSSTQPTLDDLSWMSGHWTSAKDGLVMEEVWTEPGGGVMLGLHRDAKGAKASFEFLRIAETNGQIVYLAQPGGKPPTPFTLVELHGKRAVFANPQHDFPKRIIYWLEDGKLCARVEGDGEGAEQWCWAKK